MKENNWGKPDSTVRSITVIRLRDHKVIKTIKPGENFIAKAYKNELRLIEERGDQYTGNDIILITCKKRINGKLKLVKKVKLK